MSTATVLATSGTVARRHGRARVGGDSVAAVHPLEHLRYLAGSGALDQRTLVGETAYVLERLAFDRSTMLVGCRRILERHPSAGSLWWLASRALVAADPRAALAEALDYLESDPTPEVSTTDAVVDALAAGPGVVVLDRPVVAGGVHVVVPRGRRLPSRLLERVVTAAGQAGIEVHVIPAASIDTVVGPTGATAGAHADLAPECPLAPELLGPAVAVGQ